MLGSQEGHSNSPRSAHGYYQREFDYECKDPSENQSVQSNKKKSESKSTTKDYANAKNNSGTNRPFPCHYCDRRFRQMSHVQQHERLHTGERPYMCLKCEKTFIQLNNLQAHFKRAHTEVLSRSDFCRICCQFFHNETELISHQNQSHNSSGGRPRLKERFACQYCHKDYTSEACFSKHKKFCCQNGADNSNNANSGISFNLNNICDNNSNATNINNSNNVNNHANNISSSIININQLNQHQQQQPHHVSAGTLVAGESFSSSNQTLSTTNGGLIAQPHTVLSLASISNSSSVQQQSHQLLMNNETINFVTNHMLLTGDQINSINNCQSNHQSNSHINQQSNPLSLNLMCNLNSGSNGACNSDSANNNNNGKLFSSQFNTQGILMGCGANNIINNSNINPNNLNKNSNININNNNGIGLNPLRSTKLSSLSHSTPPPPPPPPPPDPNLMLQINSQNHFLGKDFFLRHHLQKVQNEINSALQNNTGCGGLGNSLLFNSISNTISTPMTSITSSENSGPNSFTVNYQKLSAQQDGPVPNKISNNIENILHKSS